ncbi:hypothetical protein N431DRAFT_335636 [Stipitochalara longipes BDJ]|nr:hypothetical protein N431DRAFT_335636 [Stipitochalara longipes BDJ]
MASLQSSLSDSLSHEGELAFAKHLWCKDIQEGQIRSYRPYFRYYETECARLHLGQVKEKRNPPIVIAATHEDVSRIVRILSLGQSCHRPEVRALLQQQFPMAEDISINRSIDFALRVWLTMNVREERLHTPHTPTMQWDDTTTLTDFIAGKFAPKDTAHSLAMFVQLDHTFTAAQINHLSGINIEWTPCLADHLRLDKKFRVLKIYPFKQILLDQVCARETSKLETPIPLSVLKETITSLDLLFPHWDSQTANFMLQHDHTFHLEGPFDNTRPLSLTEFSHWRNRILELHQVFNSPPTGWSQLWADRRNPLQWYTFWLAVVILILTVLFGMISSITSVMQTYYAREAWKMARAQ